MQVNEDSTGMLFQPGDVAALTRALARIFSEPGLGVKMGVAGRAKADKLYRASTVAAATIATYVRIVGDSDRSTVGRMAQPLAS